MQNLHKHTFSLFYIIKNEGDFFITRRSNLKYIRIITHAQNLCIKNGCLFCVDSQWFRLHNISVV